MKFWKEKIVCFFIGHWVSEVGLFVTRKDAFSNTYMTEVPGCLRCREEFLYKKRK